MKFRSIIAAGALCMLLAAPGTYAMYHQQKSSLVKRIKSSSLQTKIGLVVASAGALGLFYRWYYKPTPAIPAKPALPSPQNEDLVVPSQDQVIVQADQQEWLQAQQAADSLVAFLTRDQAAIVIDYCAPCEYTDKERRMMQTLKDNIQEIHGYKRLRQAFYAFHAYDSNGINRAFVCGQQTACNDSVGDNDASDKADSKRN